MVKRPAKKYLVSKLISIGIIASIRELTIKFKGELKCKLY